MLWWNSEGVHQNKYLKRTLSSTIASYLIYICSAIYILISYNFVGKIGVLFHMFRQYEKVMKVAVEEGYEVGAGIV